jgi:aminopeptidase N
MATEKTFAHLWLSEGFATYFSILYFENKYGEETDTKMRRKDREETLVYSKESNHPVVDTLITNYMLLLNDNTYQKGGWVLHMLRRELGDSMFWQGIRAYYAAYAGRNADTDDLRRVFEKVSGKDLHVFFKQWLFTGGQPDLLISWKPAGKNKVSVTVTQQQADLFVFPLEIGLQGVSGKTVVEKLEVSAKKQTFTVNVNEKITGFIADPGVNLLFQGRVL